jgi:hypothetical protein
MPLSEHKFAAPQFQALPPIFGVYNFVRKHTTLGATPAVAAGVEEQARDLERAMEVTADYSGGKTTLSSRPRSQRCSARRKPHMSIRQILKAPAFVLGDLFYSNLLLHGGNVRA